MANDGCPVGVHIAVTESLNMADVIAPLEK